jgi:hypothetical protein
MGACKKDKTFTSNNDASIMAINGAINSSDISLKMNDRFNPSGFGTSNTNTVGYGRGAFFFAEGKTTKIDVLKASDSSLLATNTSDLKKATIYTLLINGTLPNVETELIEETNYPFVEKDKILSDADSVINLRFINLSPDTNPIDVKLQGATTNEATGLAYKGYTAFKAYPAKVTNHAGTIGYSTLTFQFIENGTVLKSITLFVYDPNRFKNEALVLIGSKSNSSLTIKEISYSY